MNHYNENLKSMTLDFIFRHSRVMYFSSLLYRLEGRGTADLQREDGWLTVSYPLLGLFGEAAEKAREMDSKLEVLKVPSVIMGQLSLYKDNSITRMELMHLMICIKILFSPPKE